MSEERWSPFVPVGRVDQDHVTVDTSQIDPTALQQQQQDVRAGPIGPNSPTDFSVNMTASVNPHIRVMSPTMGNSQPEMFDLGGQDGHAEDEVSTEQQADNTMGLNSWHSLPSNSGTEQTGPRFTGPEYSVSDVPYGPHINADGVACVATCDRQGRHLLSCPSGGGYFIGHDND